MVLQKFALLWPYFLLHFAFAIPLCLIGYAALSRWLKPLNIQWQAALALGVILSVYHSGSTFINTLDFSASGNSTASAPPAGDTKSKTALELKNDFLKAIDQLTGQPELIKTETKAQLFSQFSTLFKSNQDRQLYYDNIARVYDCQRYLLKDAQVSMQTKSPLKSQNRIDCEKSDGRFFNREKLLAPEVIATNDKIIETVSKKVLTEDEKKQYSPELIQKALEVQEKRLEAMKTIFQ